MGNGDDRTFRLIFSGEGVAKLREHVKEKLKEFMGDYTDDTLVEYVIVLLKNGRRKEEARNELNVFLGDDTDSFVSWLWDHIGSNLNLYVQQGEIFPDDVIKVRPSSGEKAGKDDTCQLGSESDQVKLDKSRPRHRREWKGLARDADEQPPLRSVVVDTSHKEVVKPKKVGRKQQSVSPQQKVRRKRSQHEHQPTMKKEDVSKATSAAPRRLLQFAVRDAVAASRPSPLATEPSLKRLRSVVSTSLDDSLAEEYLHTSLTEECLNRNQSSAIVPNAIVTVAEAAKDVIIHRRSSNVFDRLGCDTNTLVTSEMEYGTFVDVMEVPTTAYYSGQHSRKLHGSNDEGNNVINVVGQEDVGGTGTFVGNKSMTPPMAKTMKGQDQTASIPNSSCKMMTGSLNVNTWKSPQYLASKPFMKKNSVAMKVENGRVKANADLEKEPQKMQPVVSGSYSAAAPPEDGDSRTIFVNNVHFAATKDSLSRHFNKFGEVVKVVILADAATGQPKGSAYVEFTKNEAAEQALSLDGTSFMSRILKVVKKGSAPPEETPVTTWPRVVGRGGTFAVSRFGRIPVPRGVYGAHLPVKYGARSMQWKRAADAKSTSSMVNSGIAVPSSNAMPSLTPRSMTYIRAEQKTS